MNLGEFLTNEIRNKQGREVNWVAEQIKVNDRTLYYQLKNDCVSGKNLIAIAKVLNIDLNKLKEDF
jgi:plasmid maintenance system antidote protein VapI